MKQLIIASLLAVSLASCASTSGTETGNPGTPATATSTSSKSEKGVTATYQASLTDTKAAAVSALKLHGFDIKSETDTHIEGKRPNKVGLAVGSGGEKILVDLKASGDATEVRVETKKTFVGYAGQKNWDAPVHEAIADKLGS